jgi:hypothetical protein
MRRVTLLGAFEIVEDVESPVRDGIFLGSRREGRGFVLETSRENIEQIVTAANPVLPPGVPQRLPLTLGAFLDELDCALIRIELKPLGKIVDPTEGTFVQGILVLRTPRGRVRRVLMTATEAIQIAIVEGLPMLASLDLLQLDVSQFIDEIDQINEQNNQDTDDFRSFVDNVTASDFARYLKHQGDPPPEEPEA